MPKIVVLIVSIVLLLFSSPKVFAAISFSISNPQQDGEKITIEVFLSGLTSSSCPNGSCYLQAAFTSQNQTKYFGFTQNNLGEFYKYDGSPEPDYIKSTFFAFEPIDGSWSGKVTIKVDPEDPDYNGPGSYNIKAWRYSGNSSSYSGVSDNILTVELTIPAPAPTPTPTPSSSPTPSTSSTSTAKSPTPTTKATPTTAKSPSPKPSASPAVLGESETDSTPQSLLDTSQASPSPSSNLEASASASKTKVAAMLTGSGIVLIGLSIGFYLWYKKVLSKSEKGQDENQA